MLITMMKYVSLVESSPSLTTNLMRASPCAFASGVTVMVLFPDSLVESAICSVLMIAGSSEVILMISPLTAVSASATAKSNDAVVSSSIVQPSSPDVICTMVGASLIGLSVICTVAVAVPPFPSETV